MKQIIITLAIAMAFIACHPSGSTTPPPSSSDSTFNGSYFDITYNSRSYHVKNVYYKATTPVVTLSSAVNAPGTLLITLISPYGVYGLGNSTVSLWGSGTGTFTFSDGTGTGNSNIIQLSPSVVTYTAKTGTANIAHNGADYLEGTFTTTLEGSGFSHPATGSFKFTTNSTAMKQLTVVIILCCIGCSSYGQKLIDPPLKAITVKVEKWDLYTGKWETESISKCYSKVYFYTDMIKIKGNKEQIYFSRNNSGSSEQNGYKLFVMEYYDSKGENCMVLLSREIATSKIDLVISYTDRIQYTYRLIEPK